MRIMGQNFCCSYLLQGEGLYETTDDKEQSPQTALFLDSITPPPSLETPPIQELKLQKTNLVIDSTEIIKERAPLKPLKDNPLQQAMTWGFGYWKSEYQSYYNSHKVWCDSVQSNNFPIKEAPSYQEKIDECRVKMCLLDTEESLSKPEKTYLKPIDESVHKIEKELATGKPNKDVLSSSIQTIYENIYLLIVRPVNEVTAYKQNVRNLFIMNQTEFREALRELVESFKDSPPQELVDEIISSISGNNLMINRDTWITQYPHYQQEIDQLIERACLLIQETQDLAQQEIDRYYADPNVAFCLSTLFSKREDLKTRYENMLQGKYFSLQEMPYGSSDGTIYYPSYIPQIKALLENCEKLESAFDKEEILSDTFKEGCKNYLRYRKAVAHFQETVQPLILILQPLKNLVLWPEEYELSEDEMKLITFNLYGLIHISNKRFSNQPSISYKFLDISETTRLDAEKSLKKKNQSLLEERKATRVLLHGNIPWRALQMIGNLLNKSGGVSENTIQMNQTLVKDAFVDIIREIPKIIESIEKLIDFEVEEFSGNPSKIIVEKLATGSYTNISLLGDLHHAQRNLKKIEEILNPWRNLRQTVSELKNSKTKYAILRTVQSLGEVVKNLNNIGILSEDPIWGYLEELRDLLSHSERGSIDRRIRQFIEDSKDHMTSSIVDDFRTLLEHFSHNNKLLNRIQTWVSRKQEYLVTKAPQSNLELNGLKKFYIFLTEKLSATQITALHNTYGIEETQQARITIINNKEAIARLSFGDTPLTTELETLPLGKTQKKILTEIIKVLTSEKAAQNQFIQNRPNAFKKILDLIFKEFKNNKNLIHSSNQLTTISNNLIDCKKLIENSDLQIKIKSIRDSFFQLKQEWADKKIPKSPHLKTVEDNFIYLLESQPDFINRKKLERDALLSTFKTYLTVDLVQEEAMQVIQQIQLGQITKEELQLKMVEFGINRPSDKKLWEDALATCTKAPNSFEKETEELTHDNFIPRLKKKSLHCITFIQERLQKLEKFLPDLSQPNGSDIFKKDFQMQYASEYLVSDFRSKASNLEDYLESLRHFLPPAPQWYHEIQENLKTCIEIGKTILHVREATEADAKTSSGRIFYLYQDLFSLLKDTSLANQKTALTTPLCEKLQLLETILKAESSE